MEVGISGHLVIKFDYKLESCDVNITQLAMY